MQETDVLIQSPSEKREAYPYNEKYFYTGKRFGDALVLMETGRMGHEEWEAIRTDLPCIGGSDAATVLGYNKYKSPMMLWSELSGITKRPRNDDPSTYWYPFISEPAYWGHVHEPQIRNTIKGILEPRGCRIEQRNAILTHPEHKWMICDLDGVIYAPAEGVKVTDSTGTDFVLEGRGVLECKSASEYLKNEWTGDDLPMAYYIQVQHNLAVTGFQWAIVPALVGGNRFNWKVIPRSQEYIDAIVGVEKKFWHEHYLASEPPELDGSAATEKWLKEQYPEDLTDDVVVADEELDELARKYTEAKARLEELKKEEAEYKNKIIQQIAEAPGAKGSRYKWSLSYKKGKDSVKTTTDYEAVGKEIEDGVPEEIIEKHTRVTTYWEDVVKEILDSEEDGPLKDIVSEIVDKYSESKVTRKGSRTFRFNWKDEEVA